MGESSSSRATTNTSLCPRPGQQGTYRALLFCPSELVLIGGWLGGTLMQSFRRRNHPPAERRWETVAGVGDYDDLALVLWTDYFRVAIVRQS